MINTLFTLFRGRAAEAAEQLADANALSILDQQIRDAGGSLDRARRALAIAIAQDATESHRMETVRSRMADLETRATAALDGGREDLALEAAEAIAGLEADLMSASAAKASFARESAKLKAMTANAERRLADLERGRRAARAADAVRRLRTQGVTKFAGGGSALKSAVATLTRHRQRQCED
jgi:phage shock protein A